MMLDMSVYDILIVAAVLLVTIALGLKGASKKASRPTSARDYVLAGRALTLPLFVVSIVATWYGAVLGSGEFIARHGIVMIFCFGLPYYIAAIVYAWWFVPRYRAWQGVSIPDILGQMYGPTARRSASVVMLAMTIPAAYVLMLGTFIEGITGWGIVPSLLLGTAVAASIVVRGGLRAHALSNIVQFVFMFVGFAVLLAWSWITYGGPSELVGAASPSALAVPGTLGWPMMAAWFVIALQTFIDPNLHQRVAAVGSTSAARRGLLISVGCWFVFDMLQLSTGLYATTFLSIGRPIDTYLVAAQSVLPTMFKGIFVAGVVSAIISTLDGYALTAGATLSHDLLPTWVGGRWRYSIGLALVFAAAIVLASSVPSVVDLLFYAASVGVPAFLPAVVVGFSPLKHVVVKRGTLLIVAPALASMAAIVAQRAFGAPYMEDVAGMVVGLATSCCIIAVLVARARWKGNTR